MYECRKEDKKERSGGKKIRRKGKCRNGGKKIRRKGMEERRWEIVCIQGRR